VRLVYGCGEQGCGRGWFMLGCLRHFLLIRWQSYSWRCLTISGRSQLHFYFFHQYSCICKYTEFSLVYLYIESFVTSHLHMQVWQPGTELVKSFKKHLLVAKLAQYLVCEEDRKLASSASKKFEFYNLESRFHKHKFSFLVVKIVQCKRGKVFT